MTRRRHLWSWWGLLVLTCVSFSPATAQTLRTAVVAPDGVRLATDVYLPTPWGDHPVVLIRTPYGRAGMKDACLALNLFGLGCVAQDTRGRSDSGGTDTVFRDDGPDGRATVSWILDQPWCDGRVGTWGGSALGITQYALAPGAPVACINPAVATGDLYHHLLFQGGCLRESLVVNWLTGQGSLDHLEEALQHRQRDRWWEAGELLAEPALVTAPGLHVGGWYDILSQGTLDAFGALQRLGGTGARGRQHLVMGPWTHGSVGGRDSGQIRYPADAALDVGSMSLDWLTHYLRDEDTGVEQWPPVLIYLMGDPEVAEAPGNVWVPLDAWPPRAAVQRWWPDADGGLSTTAPPAGEVELLVDPADPVPTLGGANLFPDLQVAGRAMGAGPWDQRPVESRDDVLTFTSEELAAPVTVMGPVRCRLWVLPDTPDLDLSVRLSDVYPDGRSMLVTDGIQRARFRCGDDRECLLVPGEPSSIEVDLWSTALVFAPGHRIRVAVAGSNWPRFEVNPNDGGDPGTGTPVVARPRLLFGPGHPSALLLPVVPAPRTGGDRLPRASVAAAPVLR